MSGASSETLYHDHGRRADPLEHDHELLFPGAGQCRIADLLRVVPYPVAYGVLAGTGWMLCLAALSMCGLPLEWRTLPRLLAPDMLWRCGVGIAFCLSLLLLSRRWNNLLLLAANFLIFTAPVPPRPERGRPHRRGGLRGGAVCGYARRRRMACLPVRDVALVDWGSLAMAAPNLLAVTLVTLFSLAVNLHSLELDAEMEIDKERKGQGIPGRGFRRTGRRRRRQRARTPVVRPIAVRLPARCRHAADRNRRRWRREPVRVVRRGARDAGAGSRSPRGSCSSQASTCWAVVCSASAGS